MAITVFSWNMFKRIPGEGMSIGHASMLVELGAESVYISFWPAQHKITAAMFSKAKIHTMLGDILADGTPDWKSNPITVLDEQAIIKWWKRTLPDPYYKPAHKYIQIYSDSAPGNYYNLLMRQCSTTVVDALIAGASGPLLRKLNGYRSLRSTIAPCEVRPLIESIFP